MIDKEKDKNLEKAINGFKEMMSGLGWNIDEQEKVDMNIDKDIEILKELANVKFDKQLLNSIAIIKAQDEVYLLNIQERQAIENVLKELETKDKIIDCMANKFYELYKIYPRNNRQIF